MYLNRESVKSLVLELQSRFPSSELVCEVFNDLWLKGALKGIVNFKMRKKLHLGEDATFHFGIREGREMEEWNPGITFLDDGSYFDSKEAELGWIRFMGRVGLFRKTQWTVHYRLNGDCHATTVLISHAQQEFYMG